MTLIELLIATSIMAIMAGVLGGLALSVQMQSRHSQGHGEAVQHARVVIDRLQRAIHEASVSEEFPGIYVLTDTLSGYSLPETLVVWTDPTPVDPDGLPRWEEVTVFCPDPDAPNILVQITSPGDSTVVPAITDTATWRTKLTALKQSAASEVVELTPLIKTANLGSSGAPKWRAAVRFDVRKRPDDTQWSEYEANARDWDELDWVQGIYGTKTGLRQVWCRIELQMYPEIEHDLDGNSSQSTLTFFGSAAIYMKMSR